MTPYRWCFLHKLLCYKIKVHTSYHKNWFLRLLYTKSQFTVFVTSKWEKYYVPDLYISEYCTYCKIVHCADKSLKETIYIWTATKHKQNNLLFSTFTRRTLELWVKTKRTYFEITFETSKTSSTRGLEVPSTYGCPKSIMANLPICAPPGEEQRKHNNVFVQWFFIFIEQTSATLKRRFYFSKCEQ